MYNPKFDYHQLSRHSEQGKRLYQTPDGRRVPSVTTILDRTKPEESRQALEAWKKRVGHQQAQQITTEAANRGTRMHTYLEHYVKTGEMPPAGTNPYAWASHEMARSVIEQGLRDRVTEFWGVEIPLYFPNLYAGTTDGCGIHLGDESILDYKQSNKAKKREWIDDYFLQTVFYGTAHNEVYGTKIRKGVILMCVKPELDQQFNIIKPPIYQEFIIEGSEWDKYEKLMWQRLELYYLMS
jgi:hypothetical protein